MLAQRVQHELRVEAFGRLTERELAFFNRNRSGDLLAALSSGAPLCRIDTSCFMLMASSRCQFA